ncbi:MULTISPECIES: LCP family protein [Bacillaceae]|uniref:Polyisoprenyl-teichoic acid--peptidoglycan teichoic acid transferase TagU n=1 Tax=Evansella alkalicola TaxID=745819 RepID=A0ABS6JWX1_9BACI|nr:MULTISPECIES: LCP family protein [Bacillaceae]MBU9723066.1 LCP family protein [Bacillus alkalicola]
MKKALIIAGIIMLTVVMGIGGYGYYMYKSVQGTVDNKMHQPLEREKSEKRFEVVDIEQAEPLSFLLLGVDAQDSTRGRTDTIMVVTVNPADNSMKMLSIPRDTRTEIIGRGFDDKINHAFAFGGAEMTVNTVENFLDIPIDYYATVNMNGFKDIVDALGGVTVDNDFAFSSGGHQFNEGEIFLEGDQALAFARMRKQDTRGDFGRNDRQRQIVMAIIEEGAQFSSITRAGSILDALGDNVLTDVSFDNMVKIQEKYRSARHNMETIEITGSGTRIDNIYYLVVPEEERLRVSGELRTHLGLDEDSSSVAAVEEEEETANN